MVTPMLDAARRTELEDFLLELNRISADVILPLFRAPHAIEDKGPKGKFDPVTAADRGAEAAIRKRIAERFPAHGVIGEEYGEDRPDAELVWVIDPVDGTRAFVAGLPVWTTLIGLRFQGRPVLGSIGQPFLGETFIGHAGGSRLLHRGGEVRLRTRACADLAHATIATTDPDTYLDEAERAAWSRVRGAVRLVRLGCDAYAYAMVAMGTIDVVVEAGLKSWDVDAAVPVLEGAGGVVTDWRGAPVGANGGRVVFAGDRACIDALVPLLAV
jgi:histidinol phosphatase-like enzyme (inositol monophosphatase family)